MSEMVALETTGQDWANYLAHEVSGNGVIGFVARLSGGLDADVLRRAVSDLIGLQPVLGCRFDEAQTPPCWVPACAEGQFEQIFVDDICQGIELAMRRAIAHGRQMEVLYICAPSQAALCVRFDHAAVDGGGARRCLALLARCYQLRLHNLNEALSFSADRSDGQIYSRCGVSDYRSLLKREAPSERVVSVPYAAMDGKTVRYSVAALPLPIVKRAGGTVSEGLLAAYMLAITKPRAKPCAVSIHMTVDLRRYLDEASAPLAANLSGIAAVCASIDTDMERALRDVQTRMAALKSEHIGLSSAALMTYMRAMPYDKAKAALIEAGRRSRASGVAAPILSNLGLIDAIKFGASTVTEIIPLLPAMRAPAFMLGVCGYGDTLTLSAGYYAEERSADDIDKLLMDIREALLM